MVSFVALSDLVRSNVYLLLLLVFYGIHCIHENVILFIKLLAAWHFQVRRPPIEGYGIAW